MGRILVGGIASILMCAFLCPSFIRAQRRREFGQQIREDGPGGHHVKAGTPTMGGVVIMATVFIAFAFVTEGEWRSAIVLATSGGCGLLGLVDDYLKLKRRRSLGLRWWTKLVGTGFIATGLWLAATRGAHVSTNLWVPLLAVHIELGPLYPLALYVVLAGTTSAVNLTDGLDGLAAGCVAIVLSAYVAIAFSLGEYDLAVLGGCLVGACWGFLWFNAFPATIFMGDTGSLGLGGAIATFAIMTNTELLLPLLGAIFVVEAFSVMLQVASYRLTGRRIFLMAPIHHHFELSGLSETKIIIRFWIVTAVSTAIGFAIFHHG